MSSTTTTRYNLVYSIVSTTSGMPALLPSMCSTLLCAGMSALLCTLRSMLSTLSTKMLNRLKTQHEI
uniref:Putative seminal fluid protein AcpC01 n=1 Tax=Calomera littoralis TaxID=285225 RepID=A0A0F7Q125_CALLO|nr:putative seminal fluid protein AcpC01 [Calomera littoralis]